MINRIRTTHTGSLPRSPAVLEALIARDAGVEVDDMKVQSLVRGAVRQTVLLQRQAGMEIVNDGEQGRMSFVTYVKDRLAGFEGESPAQPSGRSKEIAEHPDWARRRLEKVGVVVPKRPACNGPIKVKDKDAVNRDISALKEAAGTYDQLFMTAASPGTIAGNFGNVYYPSHEAFVGALADAMSYEYRSIADAGLTLQVDCPDLAFQRHSRFADKSLDEFIGWARTNVEALNAALTGIPSHRVRVHVCWGNYAGPHDHDVPLREIIQILLTVNAAGLSIEAANPRHAHEFAVFDDVKLPEGKYLIPGVIDSTTDYIEHPELIAQRLLKYAKRIGRDNVMAGSDCGFATTASNENAVAPSIVWKKLKAMTDGAEIASRILWP